MNHVRPSIFFRAEHALSSLAAAVRRAKRIRPLQNACNRPAAWRGPTVLDDPDLFRDTAGLSMASNVVQNTTALFTAARVRLDSDGVVPERPQFFRHLNHRGFLARFPPRGRD